MTDNLNHYNVVIVHNNSISASDYSEGLKRTEDQFYTAHVVGSESDAFLKIMEVNPELVICCYESADINAMRMMKSLMNYEAEQRPGVLVVGPDLDDRKLKQLTIMGALDYLVEPVPVGKLRIKVKNAISNFLFKRDKEISERKSKKEKDAGLDLVDDFQALIEQLKEKCEIDAASGQNSGKEDKEVSKTEWSIDPADVKQTKSGYIFLSQGPTPDYGEWKPTKDPLRWDWIWSDNALRENKGIELPKYIFEGVEPQWTKGGWVNGKWIMAGTEPSLAVKMGDNTKRNLINFDNGKPNIFKLSELRLDASENKGPVFDKGSGIIKLDAGEWIKVPSREKILFVLIPKTNKFNNTFAWFEGDAQPAYDERKQGWLFGSVKPSVVSKASSLPADIFKYLIDKNMIEAEGPLKIDKTGIGIDEMSNPDKDLDGIKDKLINLRKLEWNVTDDEMKKNDKSYLFLASGPTPEYGAWSKTGALNKWEWTWSKEVLKEYPDLAKFFFKGAEPKWLKGEWVNGRWIFGGQAPCLSLKGTEGTEKDFVVFKDGKLSITGTEIYIPKNLIEKLVSAYKKAGKAKIVTLLSLCKYSKQDIEKIIALIAI